MKLSPGQWAFWHLDEPMPNGCSVFEGPYQRRRKVGELSKGQLLAYWRHSPTRGIYYEFYTHGRWVAVRLIGDVDAALAQGDYERHED